MSDTGKNVSVKRSPLRSVLGIIGGILGLIIGLAILNLGGKAADLGAGEKALRIIFGIVWFTFCIGMMALNALNLSSLSRARKNKSASIAAESAESPAGNRPEGAVDFETRLRKLESLRRDGLVSEEEYQRKREELLREKW
jgi:Short C-terminal domain